MRDPGNGIARARHAPACRIRHRSSGARRMGPGSCPPAVSRPRRLPGHGAMGKPRVVTRSAQTRPEISRFPRTAVDAPGAYR